MLNNKYKFAGEFYYYLLNIAGNNTEGLLMDYKKKYDRWLENAADDIKEELKTYTPEQIEDAFYCDLTFGTGGLRGIIGAGTNRMNIHTVAKASQGLANYVKKFFPEGKRKIAVSYDSRIKSDLFAQIASGVFAANQIEVYIYSQIMPTPCLSFAVRELGCSAGIMITASHNASKYNGYKVYGADGCQITTKAAIEILTEIEKLDIFNDIKLIDYEEGIKEGLIKYISEDIYTSFIEQIKKQSVLGEMEIDKNVAIVYSPLNGTGLQPVLRILKESGYNNITVVEEQEHPDGNFPTCPYPNPEVKEAMELGIEYAKKNKADLLLATDPDCDRVGIAVKNNDGEYVLLTANETGVLLLDYICARRIAMHTMPDNPVMMKTVVTTDLGERIAANYGVKTVNVLTGFKYIGEKIGVLEKEGEINNFIFGFEESYGYLTGTYVRDKDAVGSTLLICEMYAYYAAQGISLIDKLKELYKTYGYCMNTMYSYEFEGAAGFTKMQNIMANFRNGLEWIGPKQVEKVMDYLDGLDGLPKSNMMKYMLEDNCSVVVRPSGTEPKLKIYISVSSENKKEVKEMENQLLCALKGYFV